VAKTKAKAKPTKTKAKAKAKPKAKAKAKGKKGTRLRCFEDFFEYVIDQGKDIDEVHDEYKDHGDVVYDFLRREALEILDNHRLDDLVALAKKKKVADFDADRANRLLHDMLGATPPEDNNPPEFS